jgi:HK97 family phage major capsid protein
MAYDSVTTRADAAALMPEEVSASWLSKATEQSAAMSLFRRIPVARAQTRFPVLSALPLAYFVTGDTGLKQTSEVAWNNKFMNVEEIAVIIPVPDAVSADADQDVWDEIEPLAVEAMGRVLDNAIFFGVNAPASWPTNIRAAAVAANNDYEYGTSTAAQGAAFGDVDELHALVEADGFDIDGWVASRAFKAGLRRARATDGQRLDQGRTNPALTELDGSPIVYPMKGLWPANTMAFGGDWSQYVLGVRQDITMKMLDQAVIQDNTGAIVYNLAQQDMQALRLVMRVGWQVANLINNEQPNEAERYPVGVLTNDTP